MPLTELTPAPDKESAAARAETPLMKQYNLIKAKYPGALLLFRVGDFYETFGEDAVRTSRILDIVLTKRSNGAASDIPLAGFPHHSLDSYLPRLVRAGHRVAICDQLEDPKSAQGIVKRGVTELVTPGVSYHDNVLDVKRNNYLCALHFGSDAVGISFLDVSTGEFFASQGDAAYIDKLLQSFSPSEVLHCKGKKKDFAGHFGDKHNTFHLEDWVFGYQYAYEKLTGHFQTTTLKGFGIENLKEGIVAAGCVLHYLAETEHHETGHISKISRLDEDRYVWLDKFTIRNLELVYPQQEGGVPLLQILDQTVTPMGSRLMKKWVVLPLKEKARIEERLNTVSFFTGSADLRDELLGCIKGVGDLERLISKVAARRINPRELLQLKRSLRQIIPVKGLLAEAGLPLMRQFADLLNPCPFLLEKLEAELNEDPPLVTNLGRLMKDGVDDELDELRGIAFSGKDYLMQLQAREVANTGITSLKVAFNKVFGYYLEVTNAHKDKVPPGWIRKQTLVNAERYITGELKTYEEKILTAEDRIYSIEQALFNELVLTAAQYVTQIQQNAQVLAQLDCLLSFARVAARHKYVRPEVTESREIAISAKPSPRD